MIIRMRDRRSLDDLTIDLLMRLQIVCRIIERESHILLRAVIVPFHICILIEISSSKCFPPPDTRS